MSKKFKEVYVWSCLNCGLHVEVLKPETCTNCGFIHFIREGVVNE